MPLERKTITFLSETGPYGGFSNFSRHPVRLKGKTWKTSEHYFQAQKFPGHPQASKIRKAKTPNAAKRLGSSRKAPIRKDWEKVKESVMREVLQAKFTQNEDLRQLLLSTGTTSIVEAAPTDPYWGSGPDGRGKNRLGILLMELRDKLSKAPESDHA